MIYVVGASSLEKAVRSIQYKSRKLYDSRITAIPCLTFNPLSCNPLKNLQNLLQKGFLTKKQNLVIWHDMLSITLYQCIGRTKPLLSRRKILSKYWTTTATESVLLSTVKDLEPLTPISS